MQIHDFVFKIEFVNIVLSLESKNLILGLLRTSGASLGKVVRLLDSLNDILNLAVISNVNLALDVLLLALYIDRFSKLFVPALEIVVRV